MKDGAFGDLLREFGSAAALSQEALAEKARMSPGAISALERRATRPAASDLSLLAEALVLDPAQRAALEGAADIARKRPIPGHPTESRRFDRGRIPAQRGDNDETPSGVDAFPFGVAS